MQEGPRTHLSFLDLPEVAPMSDSTFCEFAHSAMPCSAQYFMELFLFAPALCSDLDFLNRPNRASERQTAPFPSTPLDASMRGLGPKSYPLNNGRSCCSARPSLTGFADHLR